jgi:choline dehydrogenase
MQFDYIVVGAGSAGCAVAARLSEAPGTEDRVALRKAIRFTRELMTSAPVRPFVAGEPEPGPSAEDNSALVDWLSASVISGAHPSSTCAMGIEPGAVLDPELRVRGVHGLRIADCSAMPTTIRGNTNAPAIMIGEKAADMIRHNK